MKGTPNRQLTGVPLAAREPAGDRVRDTLSGPRAHVGENCHTIVSLRANFQIAADVPAGSVVPKTPRTIHNAIFEAICIFASSD